MELNLQFNKITSVGKALSLNLLHIGTTAGVTYTTTSVNAYISSSPDTPVVDGLFSEWTEPIVDPKGDSSNENTDIRSYDSRSLDDSTFFYLAVDGTILSGSSVSLTKSLSTPMDVWITDDPGSPPTPGEPGATPQQEMVLPIENAEDTIYIFLDIIKGIGYTQEGLPFNSDAMIEITGLNGRITSSSYNIFTGSHESEWSWQYAADVNSALGKKEMEAELDIQPLAVCYHVVSWDEEGEDWTSAQTPGEITTDIDRYEGQGDGGATKGYWRFNDGSGTSATDSSGQSPANTGTLTNMAEGDWVTGEFGDALDFDGINDYVSVGDDDSLDISSAISVEAWINNGFTQATTVFTKEDANGVDIGAGGQVSTPAIADLDGDGTVEIVIADVSGLHVLTHDGSDFTDECTFTPDGAEDIKSSPQIANLDGDSDLEVVIGDKAGVVYVLDYTDGTPSTLVAVAQVTTAAMDGSGIALADVDGDSTIEIIVTEVGGCRVFNYNGATSITQEGSSYGTIGGAQVKSAPAVADVDGDGDLEIVFVDKSLHVYVLGHKDNVLSPEATATYTAPTPSKSGVDKGGVAIADVDGDGILEMVVADKGGILVFSDDGDATLAQEASIAALVVGSTVAEIKSLPAISDLDGDGIIEIVYGDKLGNLRVLRHSGSALAEKAKVTGLGAIDDGDGPAIADLDMDGTLELVCADATKVYVYEYYGGASPSLTQEEMETHGGTAKKSGIAIADVDGDGYLNVILGETSSGFVNSWETSAGQATDVDWPSLGQNAHNTGYQEYPYTIVNKEDAYGLFSGNSTVVGAINGRYISASLATGWHHVAMTYDGTTQTLFVDGKLENSSSFTTTINTNANDLKIGENFKGKIDEVRILNYAKTSFGGGVVLNQVEYTPSSGNEKIELFNNAGSSIDIQGWIFKNTAGTTLKTYVGSSETITAGNSLEIDLGATPRLGTTDSVLVYDLDPDNDNVGNVAEDYKSMVDFVAWSEGVSAPTSCDDSTDDAVKAGLWTEDEYVDTNSGDPGIVLTTQGNNDEAKDDWETMPSLTLTDPDGGETWAVGAEETITWTSTGSIANVKLEYSKDNFVDDINVITASTSNDGSHPWTIPDDESTTVRVRVNDTSESSVTDSSDADFTIVDVSLTITAPNGAEDWEAGDQETITWTSTGSITNVKLEYSKDNFVDDINVIIASTSNDGSHPWTIPDDPSATVRVRANDTTDSSVTDSSDAVFTLTGYSVIVTAPNGAEDWEAGDQETITWTSTGSITNVKLEYSKDNFVDDINVITASTSNDGSHPWTIPDDPSATVRVRLNDTTDSSVTDSSDADFTIVGYSLTITAPNGAENWGVGAEETITWTSTGSIANIKLEYSKDNFVDDINVITASTSNDGSHPWTIPNDESTTVRVRLNDTTDSSITDSSDADFAIVGKSLTITAPNGGQTWGAGDSETITWTSIGGIANVKLEYSKDNFVDDINVITASTSNDGSHPWTIPNDESTTVRVRLNDTTDSSITDSSDADFAIVGKSLTVTDPNGAESWEAGEQHFITWDSTGAIANVKLEYSKDNFVDDINVIIASTSNDGSYTWTIPDDASATVRVRVNDTTDSSITDYSNADFTIVGYSLIVTDPDGGEDWEAGEQRAITWTSTGSITNVKLEYSKDNFIDDINVIIASTTNDGSYTWTIPDDASATVRVRVNDTTDSSITDYSNADFIITGFSLTITDPNGGDEDWTAGTQQAITWTSTGSIASVKLEYSKSNFVSDSTTIIASTPDDGSYTWSIPNDESTTVRVRVSNVSDASVKDTSNADFTISVPASSIPAYNNAGWTDLGVQQNDLWWDTDWSYRKKLTFDNSDQTESLVNFPVLVTLSSSNFDYSKAKSDGSDLRFIDADTTTVLNYEIEDWDTQGYSYIWVNVTSITGSSSIDYIWMYYDNSGASSGENPTGVWDDNYLGVYHFSEGTGATVGDSTSNSNDGTLSKTDHWVTTGQISNAYDFDGIDDYVDLGLGTASYTEITAEVWYKADSTDNLALICKVDDDGWDSGWGLNNEEAADEMTFWVDHYADNAFTSFTDTTSHHLFTGTFDGSNQKLYQNGALKYTEADVWTNYGTESILIGAGRDNSGPAYFTDGIIDEVRISTISRSADWIAAQYLSMTDALISYGTEETSSSVLTTDIKNSGVGYTNLQFQYDVSYVYFQYFLEGDADLTSNTYSVLLDTSGTTDTMEYCIATDGTDVTLFEWDTDAWVDASAGYDATYFTEVTTPYYVVQFVVEWADIPEDATTTWYAKAATSNAGSNVYGSGGSWESDQNPTPSATVGDYTLAGEIPEFKEIFIPIIALFSLSIVSIQRRKKKRIRSLQKGGRDNDYHTTHY